MNPFRFRSAASRVEWQDAVAGPHLSHHLLHHLQPPL